MVAVGGVDDAILIRTASVARSDMPRSVQTLTLMIETGVARDRGSETTTRTILDKGLEVGSDTQSLLLDDGVRLLPKALPRPFPHHHSIACRRWHHQ